MTIALPVPHASQRQALAGARRFTMWTCGRRWGKDVLLMRRAARRAAAAPAAWFAPTYRMLSDNFRALAGMLAPLVVRKRESERLELSTGGLLDFWSLENYNAARGRRYAHVTINEAAAYPGLLDAWNMVIRPTLADLRGQVDFASTPRGLNGYYSLWQAAETDPTWSRFHATTYDNPYIDRAEIEAMRSALPERVFRQEIEAAFTTDGAYFQGVDAAATVDAPDAPDAHAGHYIVMGVDWAQLEDWTVLTVACRECCRVVDWERFNKVDYAYQRERVAAMAARWGAAVLAERNSIGLPNIELLRERVTLLRGPDGLPGFNTTASSKPGLIQALAVALEHDGLRVPSDYADELRAYQAEATLSGNTRFSAPRSAHDDRVISLALAWRGITEVSWLIV